MKNRILYWFSVIVSVFFLVSSCSRVEGPAITFSSRFYNFGEIEEGTEVDYAFVFRNPGTETLKIVNVKPTCGCTIPGDYTKEIQPGKTGKIPIVFHSMGFQGDVSKTIKVETNIPESEPIALTLHGKIRILIKVEPRDLWLGQTPVDGLPLTGIVTLKNHVDTPLKIKEITTTGERTTTKVKTITEGVEYHIELSVSPPFRLKQTREFLKVHTNIKGRELIEVNYHYYGVTNIEVSPGEIIVYKKNLRQDLIRILSVKSHIDSTIEIINPRANAENLEINLEEINPGKHIQIILHFKGGFEFTENGTDSISFIVKSDKEKTEYSIPIKDGEKM